MNRFWSLLFGLVNLACAGSLIAAPFLGWWLPDVASRQAGQIDWLFYLIGGFCVFFYLVTQAILIVAMWRFPSNRPGMPSNTHGNTTIEILWTLAPLVGLVVITGASLPVWKETKYQGLPASFPISSTEAGNEPDFAVLITSRQWDWHFRYPTTDLKTREIRAWADDGEPTDLIVPDELHVWKGAKVQVLLRTTDVIHSFFVPALRVKQDALPGKTIPLRFEPILSNVRFDPSKGMIVPGEHPATWELVCAELCGGNHSRMRGKLFVHPDKASYLAWLEFTRKQSRARNLAQANPIQAAKDAAKP